MTWGVTCKLVRMESYMEFDLASYQVEFTRRAFEIKKGFLKL